MAERKVNYLKTNNGRFFYRRRVPDRHQKTLGETMWNRPCGDVTWAKAVSLVTAWTEEHDALIRTLDDPAKASVVREDTEARTIAPKLAGLVQAMEANILPATFDPLDAARAGMKAADQEPMFDAQDRLVRYRAILTASFGPHVRVPTDPDERDEFDLVKRKLERRIADIAGDPNTISKVTERYCDFAGIRPGVRARYRRSIKRLIAALGDLPVSHITAAQLRSFRDTQASTMLGSSLASLFTPIKGLFAFAIEEELIQVNPMGSVRLQKDKRSIQERKWKPYSPEDMQRLFQAIQQFWGQPMRNMTDARRKAVWMAVRVQAFTAMRPKEVLWLEPDDVTDQWIRVRNSKTKESDRVIPLHPEISDFPEFFHAGGFDTFKVQTKDRVQSVRHNFERLTRELMAPPLDDPRQVLYSLRSTFSNAMRRAGADAEMRRAILGHAEAGALKHYDDGPEFAKKRKWVRATDPRTVYPDPGEDDDFGADDE
ncbi:MAG: hypothetical protein JNK19_03065 [Tabrizicola sp.]|nr:hypothetical protein [Tabrizicola sp.]